MKKIAIIGGGVFGSEIAIRLAVNGFQVSLFESRDNILLGATPNSVLRLHLGFHYPRDLQTAIQSRTGFREFLERFPTVIDNDFRNYYALAKSDSRVSRTQFLEFVSASGLEMSEIAGDCLDKVGFATNLVDAIYSNSEAVIDVDRLRNLLLEDLKEYGVDKNLNTEIVHAKFSSNKWILTDNRGNGTEFDFVVRSTYGHDRLRIEHEQIPEARNYEFHSTLVLEARLSIERIGMTIIDGDFLTVLPKANDVSHLLYAPVPSVMKRYTGHEYPRNWDEENEQMLTLAEKAIVKRYQHWFKGEDHIQLVRRLQTVRAIQSNVGSTDRRFSHLTLRAENFVDVTSGKIDHCIQIANQLLKIILNNS